MKLNIFKIRKTKISESIVDKEKKIQNLKLESKEVTKEIKSLKKAMNNNFDSPKINETLENNDLDFNVKVSTIEKDRIKYKDSFNISQNKKQYAIKQINDAIKIHEESKN